MGGRSSSSTAQASTNTDRSIANDEGLVFGGDVGAFNANDQRDQSVVAIDTSDRSLTDSRDMSFYASDSSDRSFHSNDSRDQSLSAVDSSNRSFNDSSNRSFTDTSTHSSSVTTNNLDGGAINAAFKNSENNVIRTYGAFSELVGFARDVSAAGVANSKDYQTQVASAWRDAATESKGAFDQKTMLMLAGLGVVGAAVLFRK